MLLHPHQARPVRTEGPEQQVSTEAPVVRVAMEGPASLEELVQQVNDLHHDSKRTISPDFVGSFLILLLLLRR